MSAIISVGLLVKRREEAEKMAARAKELIEETVPQEMKPFIELDFLEADMESHLWYNRHWGIGIAGVRKGCAEKAIEIMDEVVATFPDIQMRYYQTCEGPLDFEGVSKNGQLEQIEPWTFVVHVADDASYQRLHNLLAIEMAGYPYHTPKGVLGNAHAPVSNPAIEMAGYPCHTPKGVLGNAHAPAFNPAAKELLLDFWPERRSIGWRYDKKTEEEQSQHLLEELSRQMVDTELMAYRYDDCTIDLCIREYARARNGLIEFHQTAPERLRLIEDLWNYKKIHEMLTMEDIIFSSDEEFKKLAAEANRISEQIEEEYRQRTAQKQDSECDDLPF